MKLSFIVNSLIALFIWLATGNAQHAISYMFGVCIGLAIIGFFFSD